MFYWCSCSFVFLLLSIDIIFCSVRCFYFFGIHVRLVGLAHPYSLFFTRSGQEKEWFLFAFKRWNRNRIKKMLKITGLQDNTQRGFCDKNSTLIISPGLVFHNFKTRRKYSHFFSKISPFFVSRTSFYEGIRREQVGY